MNICYVHRRDWLKLWLEGSIRGFAYDVYMGVTFLVVYHRWDGESEAPHNCPTWVGNFFTGECKCMLSPEEQ